MAGSDGTARPPAGVGVTEALVGLAIVGVAAAAAAPAWVEWRQRERVASAAWTVLTVSEGARLRALRDGRTRGLLMVSGPGGGIGVAVDGDADGIATDDLASGRDPMERTTIDWKRIAPGAAPGGRPARGPGGARIPADGIAAPANRVSITPGGTSSSGSLYLAGPHGVLAAVRWYGPTGRVSVWLRRRPEANWERLR